MKSSRYKKEYRKNASKLHKLVGEILYTEKPFSLHRIYQEYPVQIIDPTYGNSKHTFDWVDLDLHMVIECHGEQHYEAVTFGGIDIEEAESRLLQQKSRDADKAQAAVRMGWSYIEIPYTTIPTAKWILEQYQKNLPDDSAYNITHDETPDTKHQEQLEQARAYRHEQYLQKKELKNELNKLAK